jgi:hypothetical protein
MAGDVMRVATIDRFDADGDLERVFVRVDGDIEGPYPVLDPWGVRVDLAMGQPVVLIAIEGPSAEFAAIPGFWRRVGQPTDFVALKGDVDALNVRADDIQTQINANYAILTAHTHLYPAIGGNPTSPMAASTPPSTLVPLATAAVLKGSDRLKVTHE